MTSVPRALLLTLTLLLVSAAAVAAQTIPGGPQPLPPIAPPPPSGTVTPPPPGLAVWVVVDNQNFDAYVLPYDFHFVDEIHGYGFKPGERVTITPHGTSDAAVAVVADQYGSFTSRFSFTWVFCGPRGAGAPPPSFEAGGSAGTVAQVSQFRPNCPLLTAPMAPGAPVPAPEPVSPPPAPVGTAVFPPGGTGIAQPAGTVVPVPPVNPGPPIAPPQSTPFPGSTTVQLHGFGFVPGEHVTVSSGGAKGTSGTSGTTTADSMGRFTYALTVPTNACGAPLGVKVEVSGDKGMSLTGYVESPGMCAPCEGPTNTGCPPPPGVPVPLPAPSPPTVSQGTGSVPAGQLAIRLGHASVARGALAQATVVSDSAGNLQLTVRYAGNKSYRMTRQAVATKPAVVQWRVPRTARKGPASLTVLRASDGNAVRVSFTVR